ncbi:MAG: HU family DNA-binding protein [Gemmataceae bacterium]|nr:HU family DNA-binding protein [Gemmataceae bacterium]
MGKARWALLALLGVGLALAQTVVGGGKPKTPPSVKEGVADRTKYKEAAVEKMLKALGPAVSEQLAAGRTVELPGLGILRVVLVKEGKDIDRNGKPVIVPARRYVEFVAAADLDAAANAPGAVPAKTVEPYEFRVNPGHVPGTKTDGIKTPRGKPR